MKNFGNIKTKISRPTITKYLTRVAKEVVRNASAEIPDRFGLIFDGQFVFSILFTNYFLGWTCDGTARHYYGIFLTWSVLNGYRTFLLCCGAQPDPPEDGVAVQFRATDIRHLIDYQLQLYSKSTNSIDYIGGDNAPVNIKVAELLNKPFVGCASHRLNLAVVHTFYTERHQFLIQKVSNVMSHLKNSLKSASVLRGYTTLLPEVRNQTRWSSTHNMLKKYQKMVGYLRSFGFPSDFYALLPVDSENEEISQLIRQTSLID